MAMHAAIAMTKTRLICISLLVVACIDPVGGFAPLSVATKYRSSHQDVASATSAAKSSVVRLNVASEEQQQEVKGAPSWMKCINGISPARKCAINEAVSNMAGVSLEEANSLIEIGAVWARLDTLSEEDLLDQYYMGEKSSDIRYQSDLPKGWHGGNLGTGNYIRSDEDEEDLDTYITRMEGRRYKRIMEPCIVDGGTDMRIYPIPRRFPACYDMDESSLLYEDTTFIVVDKPPMLPTQVGILSLFFLFFFSWHMLYPFLSNWTVVPP